MAYEWHKMAVSCVSELDLQNSVDNYIDSRNQTKLFQDVMFAWLFAALVGKNVAACCSHCSSHCAKFRLVISLVFRGFSQSGHNVCSDHDCDVHGRRVTGEMKLSWVWVLYWFARKLTSSNPSMPCRWIPFGLDYVYLPCQIVTILQSQCRKQLTREISNGVGKKNCCTCQQFVCVFECRWQILRIYTYMRGNRFNWYIKTLLLSWWPSPIWKQWELRPQHIYVWSFPDIIQLIRRGRVRLPPCAFDGRGYTVRGVGPSGQGWLVFFRVPRLESSMLKRSILCFANNSYNLRLHASCVFCRFDTTSSSDSALLFTRLWRCCSMLWTKFPRFSGILYINGIKWH